MLVDKFDSCGHYNSNDNNDDENENNDDVVVSCLSRKLVQFIVVRVCQQSRKAIKDMTKNLVS